MKTNHHHTYLVKLRPLDAFYFGGERSFAPGQQKNYLVASRTWPQQTSVLGMLRYLILREQNLLAKPGQLVPREAKDWIGPQSFRLPEQVFPAPKIQAAESPGDFGKILSISPVFLQKGEEAYLPAPRSLGYELVSTQAKVWYGNQQEQAAMDMPNYDAKRGIEAGFMSGNTGEFLSESDIFQAKTQVGIQKGVAGQTLTEAFYKQTFYAFSSEHWCFSFYVQTRADLSLPTQTLIPFGGERCLFVWSAQKLESSEKGWETLSQSYRSQLQRKQVSGQVLISDSLVDRSIMQDCRFAVIETLDFRFIQTAVKETKEYARLSPGKTTPYPRRSGKFNLLRRGSVLYPADAEQVEAKLNYPHLQQIGYNHFITLNH